MRGFVANHANGSTGKALRRVTHAIARFRSSAGYSLEKWRPQPAVRMLTQRKLRLLGFERLSVYSMDSTVK